MRRWLARPAAAIEASERSGTIGYLDTVEAGQVRGWAYRPHQPDRRVRVRVLVDGRPVAEDAADVYRSDLEDTGHGDGRHGFAIALPADLLDGRAHAVETLDAETGVRLRALSRRHSLVQARDPTRLALERLFDRGYYEAQAGHVSFPLDHYRDSGWRQGYDPHPLFSTRHYLAQHGPLAGDPLTHFGEIGQFSGAWTHPLLDPRAETVPVRRSPKGAETDGADAADDTPEAERPLHPLLAYLTGPGPPEVASRRPLSHHFHDGDYLARYADVAEGHRPPLLHYLVYGWREGRRPHPDFDPRLFAKLARLDRRTEPYTHFLLWLADAQGAPRPSAAPAVSVIVLNHNKSLLTLQCLYLLHANTDMSDVEIVVVDNGSRSAEFAALACYARGVTLVRLDANRGFGEGNNIGAEHARGRLLVFLNNDAFVRPGWLPPLRAAMEADNGIGAAGAKLLYPDGRLQEAGATISSCGTAVQRGKHLDPRAAAFNRMETVDYASAAALMVRADAFRAVLGFDLAWDPAYYEDADLCLKLRTTGLATVYVPASEVVHLEHATSADVGLDLRLHDIVATNRLKFVARWGDHLAGMPGAAKPFVARQARARPVATEPSPTAPPRTLALYTPYPLTPGGGERYLLTIAAAMRDSHRCILFTPDRYSRLRLLTVARDLGLDLDHVEPMILAQAGTVGAIDLFVCMANEVLPPLRGLGRVNFYHCQFPFPMAAEHYGRGWDHLASYRAVVVNSRFTAGHYAAAAATLGLAPPPVQVLAPPVPQITGSAGRGADGIVRILSVGRFAPGGHCKRQDLMIPAFEELLKRVGTPVELHLAGAVGGESAARIYLQDMVEAARSLPVVFHPNASVEQITELYGQADLYWHLTGANEDVVRHPERFEHFGIALCEAMSAGAVPVALGLGGPVEIITGERDGVLLSAVSDLVPITARLLADPRQRARLGAAARTRAAEFAPDRFAARLRSLVERGHERGGRSEQPVQGLAHRG